MREDKETSKEDENDSRMLVSPLFSTFSLPPSSGEAKPHQQQQQQQPREEDIKIEKAVYVPLKFSISDPHRYDTVLSSSSSRHLSSLPCPLALCSSLFSLSSAFHLSTDFFLADM